MTISPLVQESLSSQQLDHLCKTCRLTPVYDGAGQVGKVSGSWLSIRWLEETLSQMISPQQPRNEQQEASPSDRSVAPRQNRKRSQAGGIDDGHVHDNQPDLKIKRDSVAGSTRANDGPVIYTEKLPVNGLVMKYLLQTQTDHLNREISKTGCSIAVSEEMTNVTFSGQCASTLRAFVEMFHGIYKLTVKQAQQRIVPVKDGLPLEKIERLLCALLEHYPRCVRWWNTKTAEVTLYGDINAVLSVQEVLTSQMITLRGQLQQNSRDQPRQPQQQSPSSLMNKNRSINLGKLILSLVQGDITKEKVDAIVNPADHRLTHGGGVAQAIVNAGGKLIQEDSNAHIQKYGPVGICDNAVTQGGRLPCRFVIHTVGPEWPSGFDQQKRQDCRLKLKTACKNSIYEASKMKLTSIAFPAISTSRTGIFGMPADECARYMLDAVCDFAKCMESCPSSVRLVRIVLFDQRTTTAFLDRFDSMFPSSSPSFQSTSSSSSFFSPLPSDQSSTTDAGMERTLVQQLQPSSTSIYRSINLGKLTLSLVQGDITKEKVDAIVNPADRRLTHGGGVAQAIVNAGGKLIQEESNAHIQKYGPVGICDNAVTQGGGLPCRFVIHTVGPEWPRGFDQQKRQDCRLQLKTACKNSIYEASTMKLKSIAFPAISTSRTGIFGMPADECARYMLDAVYDFARGMESCPSSVRLVRIVLFDQKTTTAFLDRFDSMFP